MRLQRSNLRVFGPTQAAAQLETSKSVCQEVYVGRGHPDG